MIRAYSTAARMVHKHPTRYMRNGRVSLRAHLFGPREESLMDLSPLTSAKGRAAGVKSVSIMCGVMLAMSGLLYNAALHPDVQLNKSDRSTPLRDTREKARRYTSHRKLASHT